MTTEQIKVLELVKEMEAEEAKREYIPHYYKRNGQILRRSYDDRKDTPRYKELFHSEAGGIRGNKVFRCAECGEMVDYFDLESWCCDFEEEDGLVCSCCYEDGMGWDL